MNKVENIPATRVNSHIEVDLAREGSSFLKGLKQPIRTVDVRVGSVVYRMPRGADDPTPDNVVQLNGLYHDLTSGRVAKNLSDLLKDVTKTTA